MVEVGSVEVVGVYKDAGLFAGMQNIKNKMKDTADQAEILTDETELLKNVVKEAAQHYGNLEIDNSVFEEIDLAQEEYKKMAEEAAASFGNISSSSEAVTEEIENAVKAAENFGGVNFNAIVDELKDVQNKTKNVSVSMKRLKAVVLTAGVAMGGLALGFLSMLKNAIGSSPYLIGALTRIKTDLMLMGWALTKHLKPAFDLLADAIHALRTGDWEFFKTKAKEAWDYFIGVVKIAWNWIKDNSPEWISNIMQTLENVANRIINFDWSGKGLWEGFRNVIITVWDEVIDPLLPEWLSDLISALGTWIDSHASLMRTTWLKLTKDIPWGKMGSDAAKEFWDGVKEYLFGKEYILSRTTSGTLSMDMDYLKDIEIISPTLITGATGKYIAADGPIFAHAGEEIIPANSNRQTNQNPETNIILDFSGTEINLASGIELDSFAQVVSQKIADNQSWSAY